MRYPASEKLEIIRLVEQSHLPIKQTLDKLGIPRTTFYRWYDRYQISGPEALEDQAPRPSRLWNRIPDDVRRRIVGLALDVTNTLELALQASGCDQARVVHKPRLLSDNGSSYVSGELAEWLGDKKMGHVRGVPYHPQTQGKIEQWHQTLKNRVLLENYFFPADLEAQIEAFVDHYNHQRYHESINNLTPADVYFGRGQAILKQRERIKLKTMETRRLQYRKHAA
jgi:transposase InsO family protein